MLKADPSGAKDLEEYVARLASVPLAYQPGEKWRYCFVDDMEIPDADEPARKG